MVHSARNDAPGRLVTGAPLRADDGPETRLNIWDFGGQDIYHGTHALFMRTRAIFVLAWTPELEDLREHKYGGMVFRNHPLAYWVNYVRHLAGPDSPVLVVQTRCDRPENDAPCPVPEAELFEAFRFVKVLRHSARTGRGRAALAEALAEAAAWLREREGIATIGAGRYRVKCRLEAMRDADAKRPPQARQHRTIAQAHFRKICEEEGGVSAPEHLLSYLHNAGIVFYRPGLFNDDIILDQGWALDAIYAVFHRDPCYQTIRRLKGRFTRAELDAWVWGERGHSAGEQKLFLSMMQSCGICFEHRRLGPGDDGEPEYIAPDLLPDRAELQGELDQKWDADRPAEAAVFTYAMLHPGLMRSVISRIGRQAGITADYWQGGVYAFEAETRSRGLIEQEMDGDWRGRIRIRTQGGQAAELLQRLTALVEQEQSGAGMTPTAVTTSAAPRGRPDGEADAADRLAFAQEPAAATEYCVSYAWGDDTPEGRERQVVVDRLCAAAEARGIRILRDQDALGLGERISKFMDRIGRGDRVFVVLSDKYLKSPFCMYELSEVWRNCRQDDAELLKRIKVYTLPCAKISKPMERVKYAVYWKKQYEDLESVVREHGFDILGERDWQEYRRMKEFSRNVGDILATAAGILQPRSFADLVQYGFDEKSHGGAASGRPGRRGRHPSRGMSGPRPRSRRQRRCVR